MVNCVLQSYAPKKDNLPEILKCNGFLSYRFLKMEMTRNPSQSSLFSENLILGARFNLKFDNRIIPVHWDVFSSTAHQNGFARTDPAWPEPAAWITASDNSPSDHLRSITYPLRPRKPLTAPCGHADGKAGSKAQLTRM
jgi:hypothetical protein